MCQMHWHAICFNTRRQNALCVQPYAFAEIYKSFQYSRNVNIWDCSYYLLGITLSRRALHCALFRASWKLEFTAIKWCIFWILILLSLFQVIVSEQNNSGKNNSGQDDFSGLVLPVRIFAAQ